MQHSTYDSDLLVHTKARSRNAVNSLMVECGPVEVGRSIEEVDS